MKLSVIIPAYKEPYIQKTIDSLLDVSELGGELEIIPVLDGPWMVGTIRPDFRVRTIQFTRNKGMRAAINAGLESAIGDFVLKVDAHCAFAQGFDRIIVENCEENWLMVPREYSLDENTWGIIKKRRFRDYHYLNFPGTGFMTPQTDKVTNSKLEIDDTMAFQGSCWMANRNFFMENVGFLDDRPYLYGPFAADQLEMGLKYWLKGHSVKVNKKTWYAHLWKMPRHYFSGEYGKKPSLGANWAWATDHWFNNREPNMIHSLSWLIEKFWPVPTWPEDRNLWRINENY